MRVLFIDDEEDFLTLMKNRLEKRGFDILVANSGQAGLDLLHKEEVDAVVLDVKMAEMDGIEVLCEIKKVWASLPVLLLSGHASTDAAMTSIESGAADYMLKPVPLNDLIDRLRDLVNK